MKGWLRDKEAVKEGKSIRQGGTANDDIPTQEEREGGNDERERVNEELKHLGHKGFLMEQNLHNLLR